MKSKTLYYIIGVLAALLIVWIILPQFDRSTRERSATREFQAISQDQVVGFTIHAESDALVFTTEGGAWLIGEYEVDSDRLSRMWDAFEQVTLSGPVSKNADNHAAFEVDELTGTRATFSLADQTTVDLVVGKTGNSFDTSYLRYLDENDVYVSSKNLQSILSAQRDDWRSKTVAHIDHRAVSRIEYEYDDESFSIERSGEDQWGLVSDLSEDRSAVNQETLGMMFANLNPLRADGFSDSEEELAELHAIIRFISENSEPIAELTVYPNEDHWFVQNTGNSTVYEVPSYRLSNILLTTDVLTEDSN